MSKKIIALLLTAVMVLGCMPTLAENTKHERVYVVASTDGTVKSIMDSIRLENADGLKELTDRTILTGIENVGGKETFQQNGETLIWHADGKDITYQGTSDRTPAVLPVVKITLNGEAISAAELKNKVGDVELNVTYQDPGQLPALAVTVLPLPAEGVSELTIKNTAVLSELGRQVLVGWAIPGMGADLKLPDSFSVSFHADHADLAWMMTLTTSDPLDLACKALNDRVQVDWHAELDEVKNLLSALNAGEELPEAAGKTKEIAAKIQALKDGASQLADGAAALQESGTQQMKDTIRDEEKTAAESLLPYVENDWSNALRIYEEIRTQARNGGYDLRPEAMKTVTVYIIRTDLQ